MSHKPGIMSFRAKRRIQKQHWDWILRFALNDILSGLRGTLLSEDVLQSKLIFAHFETFSFFMCHIERICANLKKLIREQL
ncbi:MAG: hypothetical protein HW421_3108 [Ignavibacteria bacterium]|nr:hypothetical protein [Ignavibacteria bacterium]